MDKCMNSTIFFALYVILILEYIIMPKLMSLMVFQS